MLRLSKVFVLMVATLCLVPAAAQATKWRARQSTARSLLDRAQRVRELPARRAMLLTAMNTMRQGGLVNKRAQRRGVPLLNQLRRALIATLKQMPMDVRQVDKAQNGSVHMLDSIISIHASFTPPAGRHFLDNGGTATLTFERTPKSGMRRNRKRRRDPVQGRYYSVVVPLDASWSSLLKAHVEAPPKNSVPGDLFYPEF